MAGCGAKPTHSPAGEGAQNVRQRAGPATPKAERGNAAPTADRRNVRDTCTPTIRPRERENDTNHKAPQWQSLVGEIILMSPQNTAAECQSCVVK